MRWLMTLFFLGGSLYARDLPQWVLDAARQPAGTEYPAKVSHAVLFQEEHLTVDTAGKRVMRERAAIRILQPSRGKLMAYRSYNTKTGRIRDFRGWILYPSQREVELPKNRILDIALAENYTYDEARAKVIECDPDAPVGSVFAYDVTEEEDTVFTTYQYRFQETSPVLNSRFLLTLPAGWEAKGITFNHGEIQPRVEANTYSWELHNLPWIEDEDYSPEHHALAPRLGITYYPSGAAPPALKPMRDWGSVSAWLSGFADPPAEPSSAIRAKSAELTASAKSEMDRIRALAKFAQQVNYVSVQMNLTRGGGYSPHAADLVLARNYGDCKDKAALLRALLKSAGIDSYSVAIYSGDREFVRPEWPSPAQFNHAIVAIRVSPETETPTTVQYPGLGRLLIFDPTDTDTLVGDLDEDEQSSNALIVAGGQGALVKMPLLPAAANRIGRSVDARLGGDGSLNAQMTTEYHGQSASAWRSISRKSSLDEVKRRLERSFSRRLGGVNLAKVNPSDHADDNRLDMAVDFSMTQFGQFSQDRLLIIKPGALVPDPEYIFANKDRKLPVKLVASRRNDTVIVRLPPTFALDELPDAVQLKSRYGIYRADWKSEEGKLTFVQSLEVNTTTVPASEYKDLREFFETVARSQASAAVLLKK